MDHGTAYPWERPEIAKRIATQPCAHWIAEFTRVKITFTRILSLGEMLDSEQVRVNHAMRDVSVGDQSIRIPSLPVEVRATREATDTIEPLHPPELGEHNSEILSEFGLSDLLTAKTPAS